MTPVDWWLLCFTSKIRFGLPFLLRWRENAAWRILSTHLTGALASCKTGGAPADGNSMWTKTWHKTGESIILDTVITQRPWEDVCFSKQGQNLEDVICDMCCTWTLMDSSKPHSLVYVILLSAQTVSGESVDKEYSSCVYYALNTRYILYGIFIFCFVENTHYTVLSTETLPCKPSDWFWCSNLGHKWHKGFAGADALADLLRREPFSLHASYYLLGVSQLRIKWIHNPKDPNEQWSNLAPFIFSGTKSLRNGGLPRPYNVFQNLGHWFRICYTCFLWYVEAMEAFFFQHALPMIVGWL